MIVLSKMFGSQGNVGPPSSPTRVSSPTYCPRDQAHSQYSAPLTNWRGDLETRARRQRLLVQNVGPCAIFSAPARKLQPAAVARALRFLPLGPPTELWEEIAAVFHILRMRLCGAGQNSVFLQRSQTLARAERIKGFAKISGRHHQRPRSLYRRHIRRRWNIDDTASKAQQDSSNKSGFHNAPST